jgi:hypothetical protein
LVTDWRQIRARIRRAKTGPDAAMRLEQLFDKTRDGMVAFELAQLEEAAGRIERATDWYQRAWHRFRRSEWKQKAEEALTRHGIPIPTETAEEQPELETAAVAARGTTERPTEAEPEPETGPEPEEEAEAEVEAAAPAESEAQAEEAVPGTAEGEAQPGARRRRRRRRGGRGRGRGKGRTQAAERPEAEAAAPPAPPAVPPPAPAVRAKEPERRPPVERRPAPERRPARERESVREREPAREREREPAREPLPPIHIYRRGEPALASEIKALEAKLRQLLAAHPYHLDEVSELPASPGVYLVSDLDLTTMYYLEACGNMRVALDQLSSGRRGRQGPVRARLARFLGISDAQAGRYLKQHGLVRWIELEESDAVALGHFGAALLRPELMEETT